MLFLQPWWRKWWWGNMDRNRNDESLLFLSVKRIWFQMYFHPWQHFPGSSLFCLPVYLQCVSCHSFLFILYVVSRSILISKEDSPECPLAVLSSEWFLSLSLWVDIKAKRQDTSIPFIQEWQPFLKEGMGYGCLPCLFLLLILLQRQI